MVQHIDIFSCPACGGALNAPSARSGIECSKCNRSFICEKGIPLLFWPNEWDSTIDVLKNVKSFYEENPFPSYEDVDSIWSLRKKAETGVFARLLDDQIPHSARILEVGCGTGQLSNYLGSKWGKTVFATDISLGSLKLGQEFKELNHIDNVAFFQMNLFRPIFIPESFDFVICIGVLHHTNDPFLGFQSILRLLKKDGFIIVGLYNSYGRIPADIRRFIFKFSGNRFKFLDHRLRTKNISDKRKHMWFMDQYQNPHESKHTFEEVLSWFDRSGVNYINSVPKSTAFESISAEENLFETNARGTKLDHLFIQIGMLLRGGKEGGLFIMIGRKGP